MNGKDESMPRMSGDALAEHNKMLLSSNNTNGPNGPTSRNSDYQLPDGISLAETQSLTNSDQSQSGAAVGGGHIEFGITDAHPEAELIQDAMNQKSLAYKLVSYVFHRAFV